MLVWELRGKIIRIALCCVHSDKHTYMSSYYSSLDCVLSHWVRFTVHNFICVCLYVFYFVLFYTVYVVLDYCEHSGVDLMGLKPSP